MGEETMQPSEKLKDSLEKYSYERKIKMHPEQYLYFSHSLLKVFWTSTGKITQRFSTLNLKKWAKIFLSNLFKFRINMNWYFGAFSF